MEVILITQYFKLVRRQARWVKTILSIATTAMISLTICTPIVASAATTNSALKPTPSIPKTAYHTIVPPSKKQFSDSALVSPAVAWSVSLAASSTSLWPTQYTTLTATANQDVGPTPYYLSILDSSTGNYIAICGSGTTCSASVTQSTATTHYYLAYVSNYPTTVPP